MTAVHLDYPPKGLDHWVVIGEGVHDDLLRRHEAPPVPADDPLFGRSVLAPKTGRVGDGRFEEGRARRTRAASCSSAAGPPSTWPRRRSSVPSPVGQVPVTATVTDGRDVAFQRTGSAPPLPACAPRRRDIAGILVITTMTGPGPTRSPQCSPRSRHARRASRQSVPPVLVFVPGRSPASTCRAAAEGRLLAPGHGHASFELTRGAGTGPVCRVPRWGGFTGAVRSRPPSSTPLLPAVIPVDAPDGRRPRTGPHGGLAGERLGRRRPALGRDDGGGRVGRAVVRRHRASSFPPSTSLLTGSWRSRRTLCAWSSVH